MMTATKEPTFLYPQARKYPFDEVCEQIVRALEERNWDVPGIAVDFYISGTGEAKHRKVDTIRGDGFKLWFCRVQGRLSPWLNDTAAICKITIPGKELTVYGENCDDHLAVYVGRNWERDKNAFINYSKVNSKLSGDPRTYLQYRGRSLLVHDNDQGREYDPKGREPKSYIASDVFAEVTQWLKDNLLATILAHPLPVEKINVFETAATEFPDGLGPFFCFGDNNDARRVHKGRQEPDSLTPDDRYGMIGSMPRLLRIGVRNDGTAPELSYDGFQRCGIGEVNASTSLKSLKIPGEFAGMSQDYVFRIIPNRANDVFMVDNAPYERRRLELFEEIKPRDRLTDEELAQAEIARARTIMPIVDYATMVSSDPSRAFGEPVLLVRRDLDLDEVELVSGPWPDCQYVTLIAGVGSEASAFLEQAVVARKNYWATDDNRQASTEAVDTLAAHLDSNNEFATASEEVARSAYHGRETITRFVERAISTAMEMRAIGLF